MVIWPRGWTLGARWSVSGASASSRIDWRASKREPARDALGSFPPEVTVEIKALARELPATLGLPLSRLSVADMARHAQRSGLVARISDSTVWRSRPQPRDRRARAGGGGEAHDRERLGKFKQPTEIRIVEQLPRSPIGKLLRVLRDVLPTPPESRPP